MLLNDIVKNRPRWGIKTPDLGLFFCFLITFVCKVTQIIYLHIIKYERRYPPDRQEVNYEGTT